MKVRSKLTLLTTVDGKEYIRTALYNYVLLCNTRWEWNMTNLTPQSTLFIRANNDCILQFMSTRNVAFLHPLPFLLWESWCMKLRCWCKREKGNFTQFPLVVVTVTLWGKISHSSVSPLLVTTTTLSKIHAPLLWFLEVNLAGVSFCSMPRSLTPSLAHRQYPYDIFDGGWLIETRWHS